MAIQDTDYFLIDDDGVTKKVTALNLKNNMLGDYSSKKLLVNLSDYSSRFIYAGDMRNKLLDSHWMVKILQHLSGRLVIVSFLPHLPTILEHMTLERFRPIFKEMEEFILE